MSSTGACVEVVVGDITRLDVDAVVNAANSRLMGGGGVDGAIHDRAGPELMSACVPLAPCPTGEARITPGFRLVARRVIHTVGPEWVDGRQGEPELLASCYRSCLTLAEAHQLQSVAFPCISTGRYMYPREAAAEVAVEQVWAWLGSHPFPRRVVFCCYQDVDGDIYQALVEARLPG